MLTINGHSGRSYNVSKETPIDESFQQGLAPFNNSRFNQNDKTFRNDRAKDTFDYKNKLNYEYDELLFDGMTPAEFLERTNRNLRTPQVHVGVVIPQNAPSGFSEFALCQGTECVEGGKLGTFGAASSSAGSHYSGFRPHIDKKNYFLREAFKKITEYSQLADQPPTFV